MGERQQRLVFGEVAQEYEEVRAGFPAEVAELAFAHVGDPAELVEVGAGTGKATAVFADLGRPVTCLEPDPGMAALLRARFAGRPQVRVLECGFEDWPPPPGGVPLLVAALSWHWVDPARRWALGRAALAPGGTLALLDHRYGFADPVLEDALDAAYRAVAPEMYAPPPDDADGHRLYGDMIGSGLFVDVVEHIRRSVLRYPTDRYRRLLRTFSSHRMMAPERRAALHDALGAVVDRHGGAVDVALHTTLVLGRRSR